MKKFKISQELKPFIERVLTRRKIKYQILVDIEDGSECCEAEISGNQFHKVIKRAICEKHEDEIIKRAGGVRPNSYAVMMMSELHDEAVLEELGHPTNVTILEQE